MSDLVSLARSLAQELVGQQEFGRPLPDKQRLKPLLHCPVRNSAVTLAGYPVPPSRTDRGIGSTSRRSPRRAEPVPHRLLVAARCSSVSYAASSYSSPGSSSLADATSVRRG